MKVLLTSTSFQDCDGAHKELLNQQGWEVHYLRGPLKKSEIIGEVANYDALICGDDEIDREVLEKGAAGSLKFISKYGVGLDKIDLVAAKELGIPVTNCPGVNQIAVAEHVLAMIFSFFKNIHLSHQITSQGGWKRPLGNELYGKKIGIIGLGAIGKELARRTPFLGMETYVFDVHLDTDFTRANNLIALDSVEDIFNTCDIVSMHVPLQESTKGLISKKLLHETVKTGLVLVNTSRAGLVEEQDILDAISNGKLGGYLTDVLAMEPMDGDCMLMNQPGIMITPHISSRTKETIQRQGSMAVRNLQKTISLYA
ncbi:NAD(P)-binding domain-containing protein [Schleiferiaceae bacterium]|nr:NAD(P)-binding domain-containing protein [Schleiferiaceae bacterium]